MDFSRRSFQISPSLSSSASAVSIYNRGQRVVAVAPSVYGGAGGHGTHISTTRQVVSYGADLNRMDQLSGNEKVDMRNLNDRLAKYLEKVRSLELSNSKLEVKIKEWYEANSSSSSRDYSAYYEQIEDLRTKIKAAHLQNAQWVLKIDNAKLALEDFRMKYETERGMCLAVEADVQSLRKVAADLALQKKDLELQIEALNKDLALLKKEHQEEVDSLRKQLGKTVNVELQAAPGLNLSAIMEEMRQKYEVLAQENLQKVKKDFESQIEYLQQQVTINTGELKEAEAQAREQRLSYQKVEIDLKSHLSMKESLEKTLQDTKARYNNQLATIQALLHSLEVQLTQIWAEAERQNREYSELLSLKTLLEQEIATYRRLLEGEDTTPIDHQVSITKEAADVKKARKVKTIVEEIVNGQVVSSEVKEEEEIM